MCVTKQCNLHLYRCAAKIRDTHRHFRMENKEGTYIQIDCNNESVFKQIVAEVIKNKSQMQGGENMNEKHQNMNEKHPTAIMKYK